MTPADVSHHFPVERAHRGARGRRFSREGAPVNVSLDTARSGWVTVHRAAQAGRYRSGNWWVVTDCGVLRNIIRWRRETDDPTCKRCTGEAWMNGAAA